MPARVLDFDFTFINAPVASVLWTSRGTPGVTVPIPTDLPAPTNIPSLAVTIPIASTFVTSSYVKAPLKVAATPVILPWNVLAVRIPVNSAFWAKDAYSNVVTPVTLAPFVKLVIPEKVDTPVIFRFPSTSRPCPLVIVTAVPVRDLRLFTLSVDI